MIGRFFARQIDEIAGDAALRRYGVAMASLHLLSVAWWHTTYASRLLRADAPAICWPLFPWCRALRVMSTHGIDAAFAAYAIAAVVVGCLFAAGPRFVGKAYVGLMLLSVVKMALLALDYRLRLNQHYMAFFVSLAFLLWPGKRDALRVLVVLFYVWAATLKFNADWVTGADLYRPLWLFHGRGVVAACVYVIVLELVGSWGLLARRPWIFWPCLAQLALFHVFSWPVVSFFYPLLMAGILAIFPLCRLVPRGEPSRLEALVRGRMAGPVYALAAGFSALQLVPHLFPGDAAVTGEGRLYALHMFDARMVCEGYVDLKREGGTMRLVITGSLPPRIACDPVVFASMANDLCRDRREGRTEFSGLDATLRARRATETELRPLVSVPDFCDKDIRYDPFWHNGWIEVW